MHSPQIRLLMIEDNILDVEIIRELLIDEQSLEVAIEHCETLAAGLKRLQDTDVPIHVALLDLSLIDAQGLECFQQVHQACPELPLIILSGNIDDTLALEAVQQGAQDYLVKGRFNSRLLLRSIHNAIERQKLLLDLQDKTRQLQHVSDQLEKTNQTLEQLATTDGLTQVNNRRQFDQVYLSEWNRLCREQEPLSLLMCDVDYFKAYNDTYGHQAGDQCLQKVAQAIAHCTQRPADCVARYGGEEFVIVLPKTGSSGALQVATSIHAALHDLHLPHTTSAIGNQVTMSIGVACQIPQMEVAPSLLISKVDQALYAAKKQGRNCTQLHQSLKTHQSRDPHQSLQWVDRLSRALEQDLFQLYAQPIQSLNSVDAYQRYEILLRLKDVSGAIVTPEAFLAIADEYELMARVDRWVIQHVCEQLSVHPSSVLQDYCFHINLSHTTCKHKQFFEVVRSVLNQYHLPPYCFCFEVSESVAIDNLEHALALTQALQALGTQVALDNFGSSSTSFASLKRLPIDYLKIAGLFVLQTEADDVSKEIVNAIHRVATVMKIPTIATCVESQNVLNILKSFGVNYCQGYHLGHPQLLSTLLADLS